MYQIDFTSPIAVHFIGIGGISMSGLAEILHSRKFQISGSDNLPSEITKDLEAQGIVVFYGQRASNIPADTDLVVYTAAIRPSNPEYVAATERNLPMLSRAELLGQIMKNYRTAIAVSGTHGKTTTSSMLSEILLAADTDPTLTIGGILRSIGGNSRIGHSEYFLTEACEYTNSFLHFYPTLGVILNVEEDHMDFFKDIDDIRSSFHKFAQLLPTDGTLVINGEIPSLHTITDELSCNIITFGSTNEFDYSYSELSYDTLGHPQFTVNRHGTPCYRVALDVVGHHNILNALAAIACGEVLQIPEAVIVSALSAYHGTDRRFEYKGDLLGVSVIDDYAHHPTEITATLQAAANYPHKRLWCVFQPHTYTRTKAFLSEFADALSAADNVILADIYAARETDTLGISSADLRDEIEKRGTPCMYFPSFGEIEIFSRCISDKCKMDKFDVLEGYLVEM